MWSYIMSNKLMRTSHFSDLTKEHLMLLYAIMTGKKINVGKIIFVEIQNSIRSERLGLYFPGLITDMCKEAGVRVESFEELIPPRRAIDHVTVQYIKG